MGGEAPDSEMSGSLGLLRTLLVGRSTLLKRSRWLGGPWRCGGLRKDTRCWGNCRLVPAPGVMYPRCLLP